MGTDFVRKRGTCKKSTTDNGEKRKTRGAVQGKTGITTKVKNNDVWNIGAMGLSLQFSREKGSRKTFGAGRGKEREKHTTGGEKKREKIYGGGATAWGAERWSNCKRNPPKRTRERTLRKVKGPWAAEAAFSEVEWLK